MEIAELIKTTEIMEMTETTEMIEIGKMTKKDVGDKMGALHPPP